MDAIQVGDTVRLKSGGQTMTVKNVENDAIECNWFKKEDLKQESFSPAMLELYDESKPPITINIIGVAPNNGRSDDSNNIGIR